jgi:cytoskeletal protein RodZ
MTHISRPFQIALAAIVLFVAVWFVALRGHSSGTESSGSGASATVPATTPQQASGSSASPGSGSSSSPSAADHATAPGVAGLTRAIAKARGAVAQQQKSDHASTSASPQPTHTSSTGASHGSSAKSQQSAAAAAPAKAAPKSAAKTPAKSGVPAMQLVVESQLKQGKVVAILFWNPKGTVDAVVRRELQAASRTFGGQLAVHVARSGQVGSFGTFTRAVQVYGTPTILMVNTKGVTSSVPGLKDAFSIEQAVREVKQAH